MSTARFCACAYSIGRAQSVPPNGRSDTAFTASSSRWRGEIVSGVRPSAPQFQWARRVPAFQPRRPAKKPTISCCSSVAAVTRASAAEASRGVRPGTPATSPHVIEPDTSSASSMRVPAGSTLPNAA